MNVTVPVTWPKDFPASEITISFFADPPPTPPPPQGATISPVVIIPTNQFVEERFRGSESDFIRTYGMPKQYFAFESTALNRLEAIYAHVIGSSPYRFK
jgi:hypothetical protein